MTDLVLHQPSYLYPLDLIGRKTADVESMCGYIARLAFQHSVTITTLIHDTIGSKYLRYSKKLEWDKIHIQYINMGFSTLQVIEIMEEATRQNDLSVATLYNFRHFLGQDRLIRRFHTWCPDCYQEMMESHKHVYDKLKWQLEGVFICLLHQRYLISSCPHCNKQFPPLSQKYIVGFCPWCNLWLGGNSKQASHFDEEYVKDLWITQRIEDLVIAGQDNSELLQLSNVVNTVVALSENLSGVNLKALPRISNLSHLFFKDFFGNKNLIALVSLLKLAWAFDCSVVQLLNGKYEEIIQQNNYTHTPKEPLSIQFVAVRGLKDVVRTRQTLQNLLISNRDPWPTLDELIEEMGCSLSALNDNFPDLMKIFSELSREKKIAANERNRLINIATIKKIATALHEKGIHPGRRKIEAIMGISLSHMRTEWRRVVEELDNP